MTTKTDEQERAELSRTLRLADEYAALLICKQERAELSRTLRLADEYAALLICNEGQELETGRWKLTGVEYDSLLQASVEHLKWRGFVDVTYLNDGLIVDFTKP